VICTLKPSLERTRISTTQFRLYVLNDARESVALIAMQIGFLSEWQMYAQAIEGDTWKGEKMDKAKIDKMSGMRSLLPRLCLTLTEHRSANRAAVRTDASNQKAGNGRSRG
jgi:hypothetical protein